MTPPMHTPRPKKREPIETNTNRENLRAIILMKKRVFWDLAGFVFGFGWLWGLAVYDAIAFGEPPKWLDMTPHSS